MEIRPLHGPLRAGHVKEFGKAMKEGRLAGGVRADQRTESKYKASEARTASRMWRRQTVN